MTDTGPPPHSSTSPVMAQPPFGGFVPSGPPPAYPPPAQYPPGQFPQGGLPNRSSAPVRPWWGMGDALLMIPIMAVVLGLSLALMAVLAVVEGIDFSEIGSDSATLPASILIFPTLLQQAAWLGWPFVVSKWKGLGPAADWGWSFKPVDIGIGAGTAMIGMTAAGIAGALTGALIGLEDDALAENTQIISDLKGSPWLWGLLFVVVIGAPLSEEMLFRGLILRSVQKRWGATAGVVLSLLIFVPIHFADGGVLSDGQIVLWVSIGALGAVLSIAAVMTERLAASIIAHMIINAIASAGALGYLDRLTDGLAN